MVKYIDLRHLYDDSVPYWWHENRMNTDCISQYVLPKMEYRGAARNSPSPTHTNFKHIETARDSVNRFYSAYTREQIIDTFFAEKTPSIGIEFY